MLTAMARAAAGLMFRRGPRVMSSRLPLRVGAIAAALSLFVGGVVSAQTANLSLIQALKTRDAAQAKTLLAAGKVDPNAAEADGATALHWAANRNEVAIADQLLQKGAKVNATNAYGVTALLLACQNAGDEMISLLIRHGA